jgi:hypothetical protein
MGQIGGPDQRVPFLGKEGPTREVKSSAVLVEQPCPFVVLRRTIAAGTPVLVFSAEEACRQPVTALVVLQVSGSRLQVLECRP